MVLLVFSIILMPYCILTSTGMSTRVHHITAQLRFIWSPISLTAAHVSYHIYCHNAKANIARIEYTQRRRQHMSLTWQSVMMSSFFFVSLHSLTSTLQTQSQAHMQYGLVCCRRSHSHRPLKFDAISNCLVALLITKCREFQEMFYCVRLRCARSVLSNHDRFGKNSILVYFVRTFVVCSRNGRSDETVRIHFNICWWCRVLKCDDETYVILVSRSKKKQSELLIANVFQAI